MNCKISGRVRPFLAVAPCAAFDNERKFRASKQSLVKKTYPRGLVENEDGRVHFWDSRVGGILQLVTLAGRFNHHGAVLDFNAADVDPAMGDGEVLFVADAKGVIIDDGQPADSITTELSLISTQRMWIRPWGMARSCSSPTPKV